MKPPISTRSLLPGALGLFLLVAFVFLPAVQNGFVNYDDPGYITDHPAVRQGLTAENLSRLATTTQVSLWHPLTTLSHLVDVSLFGLEPTGHHAVNLVLHALTAALLFLLATRWLGNSGTAWVLAAVFALHPLRVESVAWASERKDVLCALFWMLTQIAYDRHVRQPSRFSLPCVFGLFLLGGLSKPSIVMLPVVLILLDFWPYNRWKKPAGARPSLKDWAVWNQGLMLEKIPFLALSLALGIITIVAQYQESVVRITELSIPERIGNAMISYATYPLKMLAPTRLAVFYPLPDPVPLGRSLVAALSLAAAGLLAWKGRKSLPAATIGLAWYLVTLLPMIGLLQSGGQAMADRYTLIPMIGCLLILASGFEALKCRHPRILRPVAFAAGMLLVLLSFQTRAQIGVWKSSETLFRHALQVTGPNAVAYQNLGTTALEAERFEEAQALFAEALKINSEDPLPWIGMGMTLQALSEPAAAEGAYRKALELRPDHVQALNRLGNLLRDLGKPADALPFMLQAAQLRPEDSETLNNLGLTFWGLGRIEEAVQAFNESLRNDPNTPEPLQNLGLIHLEAGNPDKAYRAFESALHLRPEWPFAQAGSGMALVGLGRAEEAIPQLEAALVAEPELPPAWEALGNAWGALGNDRQAIAAWQQAFNRDPSRWTALRSWVQALLATHDPQLRNPQRTLEWARLLQERFPAPAHLNLLQQAEAAAQGL